MSDQLPEEVRKRIEELIEHQISTYSDDFKRLIGKNLRKVCVPLATELLAAHAKERAEMDSKVLVLKAEVFALSENLKDRRTRVQKLEQEAKCNCIDWGALDHTRDCPAHPSNNLTPPA